MTTLHSLLPPSSAARRVACPGSRALEERYKDTEHSPAAREGEAAHWIAAQLLLNESKFDSNITVAPNGEILTDEMIEGAVLYWQTISLIGSLRLNIEERIDISVIHPDCFGTPDCWFIGHDDTVYLFDYKFGYGHVEVFENWQLIEYAAGILDTMDCDNPNVIMTIVQPRSYHRDGQVRTWKTSAKALRPYFDRLRDAEEKAARPYANCYVSSECRNCLARHVCPTLEQAALSIVDESYLNVPRQLSPSELGRQLSQLERSAELLNARITGLTEEVISKIRQGEHIPGYAFESGKSREIWAVEHAEIIALGELFNAPLMKQSPITPLQAIKTGIPQEIVKAYTEVINGTTKLVKTEITARKIFGGEK